VALGLLGLDGTGVVQTSSEKVDGPAWHPRVRPQHPVAGHLQHALAMLSASCSFNLLPLNQICHRTQLLVAVAKGSNNRARTTSSSIAAAAKLPIGASTVVHLTIADLIKSFKDNVTPAFAAASGHGQR
jgi:hypothetical protein